MLASGCTAAPSVAIAHTGDRFLPVSPQGMYRSSDTMKAISSLPGPCFQAEPSHNADRSGAVAVRRLKYPFRGGSFVTTVVIGDLLVSAVALCLAWWLRFHTGLGSIGYPEPLAESLPGYSGHIILGVIVMAGGLLGQRAYNYEKLLSAAHEIRAVVIAIGVWLATYLSLSLLLQFHPVVSRLFCLLAFACLIVLFSYWRLLVAHYLAPRHMIHSPRRRILLVGWNNELRRVADVIARSRSAEMELCGVVIPAGMRVPSGSLPPDVKLAGTYEELADAIDRTSCDGVIVGDLDLSSAELGRIAALCEEEMVDFELVPTCFPVLRAGLSLRHFGDVPVLGVGRLPLYSPWNLHAKRIVDIIGAVVGLIAAAPVIAILAGLIYRESPGPVLFRQRRIGIQGKEFTMYKLRSMCIGAETQDHCFQSTSEKDPRLLRLGGFIRRWNLDELPQFWNVLAGDMSLVGPRPERPYHVGKLSREVPHYNLRHSVKPGITGWAQVNGFRGETDLVARVRYDLYYIENWKLWLDLQILLMTLIKPAGGA